MYEWLYLGLDLARPLAIDATLFYLKKQDDLVSDIPELWSPTGKTDSLL